MEWASINGLSETETDKVQWVIQEIKRHGTETP